MVYKKYIKRDGKWYGPYLYSSHRINGKVISEYQGTEKKDNKKFIFLIFGILILLLSIFIIFNQQMKISGKVVSESEAESVTENFQEEIIYPTVYFTLISTQIQEETTSETTETQESVSSETTETSSTETVSEINESNSGVSNQSAEEILITENETTVQFENSTEQVTEEIIQEETTSETTETQESVSSETTETSSTETVSETTETPSESSTSEIVSTEIPESTSAPITGGVISQVLKSVSNFFLTFLNPTGMAVSGYSSTEIFGETSYNQPFTREFTDGENIELLSGSVRTASKTLPDNTVTIYFQGSTILVKTNYSELTEVNYSQSSETNSSGNETEKIELTNFEETPLDDDEKGILLAEFGNVSIETVKSELFNERYVIKYKLGTYEIEYSYNSNLNNETLEYQMEKDRIKWMRSIINKLSEEENVHEEASQFLNNYSLN